MLTSQISLFSNLEPLQDGIIYSRDASTEEIKQFIQRWSVAKEFALDIETYGREENDPLDPWKGRIRTIQIGLKSGECLIADLGGWDDDRDAFTGRLEKLGFFQELKRSIQSKFKWLVGHNLVFDLQWLIHTYGYKPWRCADTMILSQLYWAGIEPYRHSLKAVCERLGIGIDKEQQRSDWGFELTNEQLNYAGNDVKVLFEVWGQLGAMCVEAGLTQSVNTEFKALPAFAEMNVYGFPADEQLLDEITNIYQDAANGLAKRFNETFPDLTVDDNRKLPPAIKEKLGINVSNSDKNALNPHRDNPVISSLLSTRSIGAYLDYLANMKLAYRDGAIRGGFRQNAPQGRGRSTSGKTNGIPSVNLQNPPNPSKACPEVAALKLPPIRSIFRPEPGYKLLVVDLSAAHARIAAETTQDELFIASYIDNVDVHAIVASKLSYLVGKFWTREDISRIRKGDSDDAKLAISLRNTAKNVFYGWLNGAGIAKTAETIRIGGYECDKEFAESILKLLGESFPGIKTYHDQVKISLKQNIKQFEGCKMPYTWATGLSGRRVYLPVWPTNDKGYGGAKPTDALMVAWMTVEADAVKMACHLVRRKADQHPEWGLRLVNICHDELNAVCREEHAEEAAKAVWMSMQTSLAYFVRAIPVVEDPFKAESVICSNWSEK